jgi:hypothetical protein
MRKKVLVVLYIALCMTMTLPVYAKKGGEKAPTIVTMTGGIEYQGRADVRDTRTKIVVRVYAKNPVNTMTFDGWHTLVNGDHNQFEFEFYVHKTDGALGLVRFTFAWENYVMKALGVAEGVSGDFTVTITEGYVYQRGHGNQPPIPKGEITIPEPFTVT